MTNTYWFFQRVINVVLTATQGQIHLLPSLYTHEDLWLRELE